MTAVWDKPAALKRLMHNEKLYSKILTLFISQAEQVKSDISANSLDDLSALHHSLHSLKGSAGEVGAVQLYQVLFEAEQKIKQAPETVTEEDISKCRSSIELAINHAEAQ